MDVLFSWIRIMLLATIDMRKSDCDRPVSIPISIRIA
jgi:hypothetical protein